MLSRRPWIVAFMNHVSSLGTATDLDAVYGVADTLYPDSRFIDPEEAAESHFGNRSRTRTSSRRPPEDDVHDEAPDSSDAGDSSPTG